MSVFQNNNVPESMQRRSIQRNTQLFLFISFCFFLVACEENPLPEEMTGEIVFYAEGRLAGENMSLEAGVDDYYMESSYTKNNQGLYSFQGTFMRPLCADCGEELLIEISDKEITPAGQSPNIGEALKVGSYTYKTNRTVSDIFEVDFVSETVDGIDSTQWDFGDGNISLNNNPQHSYVDPQDLSPQVCLRTVDENGCESILCNEINLDTAACKVDFSYMIDENTGFVSFIDQSEGQPPLQYRWDFGDGFGASLGNPGYYFGIQGSFTVCLTVKDASGCKQTLCKNIGTEPSYCNTNFNYSVYKRAGPTLPQFSKVRIQWTDASGKVYSSDQGSQAATSKFEILSSEAYEENQRGEKTRKLDIRFTCMLFDEEGNSIEMDVTDGVVAVAHP